MPANTSPIYTLTPNVDWTSAAITSGNAAMDGTGPVGNAFLAGANGSYVQRIRFRSLGTNAATVGRVFITSNTGGAPSNTALWDEITLPSTTLSQTGALQTFELPLNFAIQANYKINVTLGTTVAAGYMVTVIGGDY